MFCCYSGDPRGEVADTYGRLPFIPMLPARARGLKGLHPDLLGAKEGYVRSPVHGIIIAFFAL